VPTSPQRFYTPAELAAYYRVSVETIRAWARDGKLAPKLTCGRFDMRRIELWDRFGKRKGETQWQKDSMTQPAQ